MNVHRCLRLLSILILLLFFSCDAEIDSNETLRILGNYEAKTNVTTRYLSLKETQDIIGLLESKTGKLVSKSNSSEIETQFGTVYLDSALVALDTLGRENISFSILPDNPNPRVTFNLVVGHSEDRINRPVYLIALEKSEEYYNEEQNGISDFTNFRGKLYRYPVEDLASKSSIITSKGVCPPNDITSNPGDGSSGSGGGSGNGDSGGSPSGEGNTGSTGGSYDPCVLTVVYDRCSVGGDANGHAPQKQGDNSYCSGSPVKNIFMSGDCGFGGQSNKSSSTARGEDCPDINGPVAINLISVTNERIAKLERKLGLNDAKVDFLRGKYILVNTYFSYLETLGYTQPNMEFVNFALEVELIPTKLCGSVGNDCIKSIKVMADGLRKNHGAEGQLMADYFDSLISDYSSFTRTELTIFHNTAKKITSEYNIRNALKLTKSFINGVMPIVEIALFEVGGTLAIKLLSKIPISWVLRGSTLTPFIQNVVKLGVQGNQAHVRIVQTTNPVSTAKGLFRALTRDAVSRPIVQSNGTIVANMGNGNFITYRTVSSTGFPASINFNFQQLLGTNNFVIKFGL